TPAGSPGTSASRGRGMSAAGGRRERRGGRDGGQRRIHGLVLAEPDVHVGVAAHLAQEAVPLLLELALADRLAHLLAAGVVLRDRLARALALHDVPAGLGPERRGHLAVLQRRHLRAEVHAVRVLREPAELAAAGAGRGVLGVLARDLGEVGAAGDARAQRLEPGLGRGVVALHQDVPRLEFGDAGWARVGGRARLHQLHQLEAAGAADRADHFARLHAGDDLREG